MEKNSKIYVAGHAGLVGSAIKRELEREGYTNIIFKSHSELDLTRQKETEEFFLEERPEYVFDAAAKVGGIYENDNYPANFIYENLQIQSNLIHFSHKIGVKKLLFIGSNCMYPRDCQQPMNENYLLTGKLESTNEPFAIAKIAGVKMCQAYNKQYYNKQNQARFISVVPASLFGENDDYDTMNSHFVPAVIKKFHEAKIKNKKEVVLWGTGNPRRELMYVDDFADVALFLMKNYNSYEIINAGTGKDATIREIANIVKKVVGFEGEIVFDETMPDGMMKKLLDSSKIKVSGWKSKISLEEGLRKTYDWFIEYEKGKVK